MRGLGRLIFSLHYSTALSLAGHTNYLLNTRDKMNFKNNNPSEHAFFTSLGYEEKQYGYVRHNDNETTQIITPFDDYRFQVWGTPEEQEYDEKIYNTGVLTFASFHQLQAVVILFEQIKDQE